nr:helix-turn-helix domain-containing protein [Myroides odoratimimus]
MRRIRKIKVSRYYLAQYFTYKHKMSFREYINSLRIKEILDKVDKLTCKKEMTANELFFQSAFNSKASFFKSFKNVTGMTPAEYIKLV